MTPRWAQWRRYLWVYRSAAGGVNVIVWQRHFYVEYHGKFGL